MRISIDVSQLVYQGTGVANYTQNLVKNLLKIDQKNEYLLFGYSLRQRSCLLNFCRRLQKQRPNVKVKIFPLPPTIAEFIWNRLHLLPIEWLIGSVDVFLSSDWIQPPAQAKKVTTIHDLIPLKFPQTLDPKIVHVHRRRLHWVKKECDLIICDSEATKKDVRETLGIEEKKLRVIYPGVNFLEDISC